MTESKRCTDWTQERPPNHSGTNFGPGYEFLGSPYEAFGRVLSVSSSLNSRQPGRLTTFQQGRHTWNLVFAAIMGFLLGVSPLLPKHGSALVGSAETAVLMALGCALALAIVVHFLFPTPNTTTYVQRRGVVRISKGRLRALKAELLEFNSGTQVKNKVYPVRHSRIPGPVNFSFRFSDSSGQRLKISAMLPQWPPTNEMPLSVDHPWHFGRAAERAFTAYLHQHSDESADIKWFSLKHGDRVGLAPGRLLTERNGRERSMTEDQVTQLSVEAGQLVIARAEGAVPVRISLCNVINRAYFIECLASSLRPAADLDPEAFATYR